MEVFVPDAVEHPASIFEERLPFDVFRDELTSACFVVLLTVRLDRQPTAVANP